MGAGDGRKERMMVEGQSLVTDSGREETDDGHMVNLPFTSLPLLFFSGSHSTDEETEVREASDQLPSLRCGIRGCADVGGVYCGLF